MSHPQQQRGSAMMVSLVFLIVIGLMGLTSLTTSRLELRMSNNDEARAGAMEISQALGDAVVATPAMTPLFGDVGTVLCTPGQPDCDMESLFMPSGELASEVPNGYLSGTAVLKTVNVPPPRGLGYSADKFSASQFEVTTTYDRSDGGRGRFDIVSGLVVLTPEN